NEFVDQVAQRAGLPAEEVAQREERAPGLLERLARTLAVASPEMFISSATAPRVEQDEATIVKMTERVIAEADAHGRVVLVGRHTPPPWQPRALHPSQSWQLSRTGDCCTCAVWSTAIPPGSFSTPAPLTRASIASGRGPPEPSRWRLLGLPPPKSRKRPRPRSSTRCTWQVSRWRATRWRCTRCAASAKRVGAPSGGSWATTCCDASPWRSTTASSAYGCT